MNLKIRLFKQSIVNFVDESDLPVEVKRMVLGEINNEIEKQANLAINAELKEENRKEQSYAESIQSNQLGELSE